MTGLGPGPFNTLRRRDKLRTLDHFYDSFSEWYAFALGYNSLQEMEKNKRNDEDVFPDANRKPSQRAIAELAF